MNLLLIAALREAGFTANPLVLSTRAHGRLQPKSPMLNRLNYAMAHVALPDGQEVLLDATDELAPDNMIPSRCLNGQGRLVLPGAQKSRWIDLRPEDRLTSYRQVTMTLDENGGLRGNVHQEHAGYLAQREKLRELGKKKYVAELGAGHEGWSIPKYAFKERDELHKPPDAGLRICEQRRSQCPGRHALPQLTARLRNGEEPFLGTKTAVFRSIWVASGNRWCS